MSVLVVQVGIGVLLEQREGRERLFINPKLMSLITRDGGGFELYG